MAEQTKNQEEMKENKIKELETQIAEYQILEAYQKPEYRWIRLMQTLAELNETLKKGFNGLGNVLTSSSEKGQSEEDEEYEEEDEEYEEESKPKKKKRRV